MNGGYGMLDLSVLDWETTDDQDYPGIFEKADDLYRSRTLILVGTSFGGVAPAYIRKVGTDYQLMCYLNVPYQVDIKSTNVVIIESMT